MKDAVAMQLEFSNWALHENVAGISHEESLRTPERGGNSLNWVVGHLATTYDLMLEGTGGEGSLEPAERELYRRGSDALDAGRAVDFARLVSAFESGHTRLQKYIAGLSDEDLSARAPFSPRDDPEETIGSLLVLIAFHQAYHTGQTGVLRRVVGRDGAIG